tara:strand:- start:2558 stop:2935 length:378 start_codon:yes stop_codon:yes gene_type:complete
MSKEEKEIETWTIESLIALTDEVQNEEIDYRGKVLKVQFCELTEEEEPTGSFKDDFENEEERMTYYQELGTLRVLKMIEKANEKVPENKILDSESWAKLPTTLRYAIANKIMAINAEVRENFTMG